MSLIQAAYSPVFIEHNKDIVNISEIPLGILLKIPRNMHMFQKYFPKPRIMRKENSLHL